MNCDGIASAYIVLLVSSPSVGTVTIVLSGTSVQVVLALV